MWADGQRRSHAYRFYQMEDNGNCLQDDLYQITDQEPYNQIDELSIFNDDEIVIHQEGEPFIIRKKSIVEIVAWIIFIN